MNKSWEPSRKPHSNCYAEDQVSQKVSCTEGTMGLQLSEIVVGSCNSENLGQPEEAAPKDSPRT